VHTRYSGVRCFTFFTLPLDRQFKTTVRKSNPFPPPQPLVPQLSVQSRRMGVFEDSRTPPACITPHMLVSVLCPTRSGAGAPHAPANHSPSCTTSPIFIAHIFLPIPWSTARPPLYPHSSRLYSVLYICMFVFITRYNFRRKPTDTIMEVVSRRSSSMCSNQSCAVHDTGDRHHGANKSARNQLININQWS
jgi:hypothetical protein